MHFFRFRVYLRKLFLTGLVDERKLGANEKGNAFLGNRRRRSDLGQNSWWQKEVRGNAVAVITGHIDNKGSRQGERTATDSSSTDLFIAQCEEENARHGIACDGPFWPRCKHRAPTGSSGLTPITRPNLSREGFMPSSEGSSPEVGVTGSEVPSSMA